MRTSKRAVTVHLQRGLDGILDYAFTVKHDSFDTAEHRAMVDSFLARS
jgi:enoyl-CoA hydratase